MAQCNLKKIGKVKQWIRIEKEILGPLKYIREYVIQGDDINECSETLTEISNCLSVIVDEIDSALRDIENLKDFKFEFNNKFPDLLVPINFEIDTPLSISLQLKLTYNSLARESGDVVDAYYRLV